LGPFNGQRKPKLWGEHQCGNLRVHARWNAPACPGNGDVYDIRWFGEDNSGRRSIFHGRDRAKFNEAQIQNGPDAIGDWAPQAVLSPTEWRSRTSEAINDRR
jgi:hypothetical protein